MTAGRRFQLRRSRQSGSESEDVAVGSKIALLRTIKQSRNRWQLQPFPIEQRAVRFQENDPFHGKHIRRLAEDLDRCTVRWRARASPRIIHAIHAINREMTQAGYR